LVAYTFDVITTWCYYFIILYQDFTTTADTITNLLDILYLQFLHNVSNYELEIWRSWNGASMYCMKRGHNGLWKVNISWSISIYLWKARIQN